MVVPSADTHVMRNRLHPLLVLLVCTLLTGCSTMPPQSASAVPQASDIAECESAVRSMWQSADVDPYAAEPMRSLWRKDLAMFMAGKDPGYGRNPVHETQDEAPEILTFGPGYAEAGRIVVPLTLQFRTYPGNPTERPFNKSFIFTREGSSWKLQDIKTEGRNAVSESFVEELKSIDASR